MRQTEREKTNRSEQDNEERSQRLPTARAVFRPRSSPVPPENREPERSIPSATSPEVNDLIDPFVPGYMNGYRISLFAVGREELAGILPEQRETIAQLTDLQVEELAIQVEEALTEICRMTLRAVLMTYLGNPSTHR